MHSTAFPWDASDHKEEEERGARGHILEHVCDASVPYNGNDVVDMC